MRKWLHPRAFWLAALLILILQFTKVPPNGVSAEWLGAATGAVLGGGAFWGAVGTFVYNRFYKR